MEDTYTGLLNRARELKDSRKPDGGGEKGSGNQPGTSSTVSGTCMLCGEQKPDGYLAPCCGKFLCAECIGMYEGYNHLFQVGGSNQAVCPYCTKDLPDTTALARWVPAALLPNGTGGPAVGSDAEAWNFTLHHSCGEAFVVVGWQECDVLEGDCPKCGSRSVNLTGSTKGHSYELRDILDALGKFHPRASVASFAALRTNYPHAWQALRLTSLVNTVAAGTVPDLSLWNPEAVEFLTKKAKDIAALLQ